jgi:hypothetical protein
MPLPLMAASTAVIFLVFAALASRAVLPWLVTPMRITAESGATATVASPVTVTSLSTACAENEDNATAAMIKAEIRMRTIGLPISPARTH